jgi:hypothetical protein
MPARVLEAQVRRQPGAAVIDLHGEINAADSRCTFRCYFQMGSRPRHAGAGSAGLPSPGPRCSSCMFIPR